MDTVFASDLVSEPIEWRGKHTRSTGVDDPSSGSGDDSVGAICGHSNVDTPVIGGWICLRHRNKRQFALVLYTTQMSHLITEDIQEPYAYQTWINASVSQCTIYAPQLDGK